MFSKCLSKPKTSTPKGPYTPPVENNGSETSSGSDEGRISSKSYERLLSKEENSKWKTPSIEDYESESSSDSEKGPNISSKSDEKRLITKKDDNKENKLELKKLQKQNKVSSQVCNLFIKSKLGFFFNQCTIILLTEKLSTDF